MAAIYIHRQREAVQKKLKYRRFRRNQRETRDPFQTLSDVDFEVAFRMNKNMCRQFVNIISPHLKEKKQRHGISAVIKILCALRFYASGSYQYPVGMEGFINLSQPSVSRIIREVSSAIVEGLADLYIYFPDDNHPSRQENKERFFIKFGMPGVIGVVDGTHILIKKPNEDVEYVYYAVRKAAHTKNVQVICDFNLKIIGLNARYGGSTHDSYIWNNSNIKQVLHAEYNRGIRHSYLLGDSGYGQQPWLLTPIANTHSDAECAYNYAHQKARHIVERCIGVLKSRFRCLCRQRILMYSPEVSGEIIIACAVLHNIMIEAKYPLPEELLSEENIDETETLLDDNNISNDPIVIRTAGNQVRDRIVAEYFSTSR